MIQGKRGRGGARKGAGRKPLLTPKVNVTLRLRPESRDQLKQIAKARGITITAFIESAIQQALSENE